METKAGPFILTNFFLYLQGRPITFFWGKNKYQFYFILQNVTQYFAQIC